MKKINKIEQEFPTAIQLKNITTTKEDFFPLSGILKSLQPVILRAAKNSYSIQLPIQPFATTEALIVGNAKYSVSIYKDLKEFLEEKGLKVELHKNTSPHEFETNSFVEILWN